MNILNQFFMKFTMILLSQAGKLIEASRYQELKSSIFGHVIVAFGCSNKSGRTTKDEGKGYFKIPDPKKNCEQCTHCQVRQRLNL